MSDFVIHFGFLRHNALNNMAKLIYNVQPMCVFLKKGTVEMYCYRLPQARLYCTFKGLL